MRRALARAPIAQPDRIVTERHDPLQVQVAELFDRLRLPVYRYLVIVLGRTGEAEELTQEVFIRLYDYLRVGHPAEDARYWLFRVAHNLALNVLRRRRHMVPLDHDLWVNICHRVAATPDPEHRVLHQEQRRRLAAALGELSAQERQCLALRAEGLRYRQIAELLDITYAAAVDSLRRGIAKLTRALHD